MSQPTEYSVYYLATDTKLYSGPYFTKDDAIDDIDSIFFLPSTLRVVEMRAMGTPVYFLSDD
jgi:hypothetical protein